MNTNQEVSEALPEKKNTLWDLLSESQYERDEILRMISENGGELSPELESQLDSINPDLPKKIDCYNFVIEDLESSAELFKSRANQMAQMASSLSRASDRIKSSLKQIMIARGLTDLEGEVIRFKLSETKKRLVINGTPPAQFMMTITEVVPDKEMIKQSLELGESIEGCSLEGGFQLRKYLNKGKKK